MLVKMLEDKDVYLPRSGLARLWLRRVGIVPRLRGAAGGGGVRGLLPRLWAKAVEVVKPLGLRVTAGPGFFGAPLVTKHFHIRSKSNSSYIINNTIEKL